MCNCNLIGSVDQSCDPNSAACTCKPGVTGTSCDACISGYYGFSEEGCQECECSEIGSTDEICDVNNGTCSCKPGYTGLDCDQCASGFFESSTNTCVECQCDEIGTVANFIENCNASTGQCLCKSNVVGRDCNTCASNYTNLQDAGCSECDCLLVNTNTSDVLCDAVTGQCNCLPSAIGLRCDSCQDSYYKDSEQTCLACNCSAIGAVNGNCAPLTGECLCVNENITGGNCDRCDIGHYNFPR